MKRLRLASYNMHKAVGTDRRRDPLRVLEVIAALEADVVVLQEADRRLGPRPAALPVGEITARTGLVPVPLGQSDVALGFHGNAVLVRPELRVSAPRRIDLPGFEPRGAVAVTVAGRLVVAGVHLGLLRRSRRAQLERLATELSPAEESGPPVAMLGDFNEWSLRNGFEPLAGRFEVHAPGRTYHAANPLGALDRVALAGPVRLIDAGVMRHGLARVASDHLPIWADVLVGAAGQRAGDEAGQGTPHMPD